MKSPATAVGAADTATDNVKSSIPGSWSHVMVRLRRIVKFMVAFMGVVMLWMVLYHAATPFGLAPISYYFSSFSSKQNVDQNLQAVMRNASMNDKTVILTTLNDAWAEPGSIFDLFLESFRIGNGTEKYLKHLVVITLDQKAHNRCLALHPHCYQLLTKGDNFSTEAYFMSEGYLHMMWRRIEFLVNILEMGYNFVFTDTDIMWYRDPFKHFYEDADFQIACDYFNGNPFDRSNYPNGGFNYAISNERTLKFYKFWYASRMTYPNLHDQDVLNKIKKHSFISQIKLKMRFLDTAYFGGFCQASKDFNKVCTMHANCCIGLDNKINDLKILLDDWRNYMALPQDKKANSHSQWHAPQACRTSFQKRKQKEHGK